MKLLVTAVLALVFVPGAFAHAELSPPVAKAKTLQLFTLAVPTEKENATTTKVEFTPPQGFGCPVGKNGVPVRSALKLV